MAEIKIFSQEAFDEYCVNNGINDDNVEKLDNKAFISIIGTKDIVEKYLEEPDTKHYFKENHNNVLNLEFDDVSEDVEFRGIKALAITSEQCDELVDFIDSNVGKDFYIHCRAGISRSRAVGRFIRECHPYEYWEVQDFFDTANIGVLRGLKRAFYKKNNIYNE